MEINARFGRRSAGDAVLTPLGYSDARSTHIVEDRIRPALESGSAVGAKRPVLIIIDEIDGATGGGDNVCLSYRCAG